MIKRFFRWFAIAISSTMIMGCFSVAERPHTQSICTDAWYALVEKQLSVGDQQGHGPDLGSLEWRSAVEFKLGLRDDANVPELETDLWCAYIHQHHFATKTAKRENS